jgi:glycerophosphoryl diester phosphodiesterase
LSTPGATAIIFDRPIAHRGLHGHHTATVENSPAAFAAAIAHRYAIECDLQISSDDVPIVFHDDTLERLTGAAGPVNQATAKTVSGLSLLQTDQRPPLFSAFLEQIAGRTPLIVELKKQADPKSALARRVVEIAAGYAGPIAFKSFDPSLVAAVKQAGFPGPVGIVVNGGSEDANAVSGRLALQHLVHAPANEFDFLSLNHLALQLPAVDLLRRVGKKIMAWTIRTPAEAAKAYPLCNQIVFEGFLPPAGPPGQYDRPANPG